ncbi:OmpA family protein [Leptospira ryugenii]|uniref:OmpA family protein n=1 Tax=Leptospira ryugenii TaxID=1917863 RepID=A0A2P2E457_9LEPT|nr:OmpA family protein [Leptospira ryugenii]GBF51624.1 OmpA family protein [Leptospira ryugenii]
MLPIGMPCSKRDVNLKKKPVHFLTNYYLFGFYPDDEKVKRFLFFSLLLSFSCLFASDSPSFLFRWKWNEGQVLELNEYHDVIFRMGNRSIAREDRNRVLLKTLRCDNNACDVFSFFDTYIRYGKTEGPFQKDKAFESKFTIFRNGKYVVPDEYIMPNLRSFPTFPDAPIQTGDSWKLPAEESFDFNGERIKVKVEPEYMLLGRSRWQFQNNSGNAEKITYTYPIFYDAREERKTRGQAPVKIFGFARGSVFFNVEKGLPEYKEVKLSYTFILADGTIQEANYDIKGIYQYRKSLNPLEKEKVTADVLKDLIVSGDTPGKDKETPVTVRQTEEGVTFSLDSILFDFNESKLKEEAEEAVKKIASILKKYPDREIRVSGHTDNIGKKEYNERLSEERAKSVLKELVQKHGMDESKISFKGYADTQPIVSNDSEENRAKNRRVDITIILD